MRTLTQEHQRIWPNLTVFPIRTGYRGLVMFGKIASVQIVRHSSRLTICSLLISDSDARDLV